MADEVLSRPYRYERLDTSRKEIRLLELECSQCEDFEPIKCNLIKSSVNTTVPYEALSYVWGDSTNRVQLRIGDDGDILYITKNLDTALRHLRLPSVLIATNEASSSPHFDRRILVNPTNPGSRVIRRIWIDAICINQFDERERGEQVRIMFDLYSKASRVLIWLGEERNNSDQAMDLVCQIQANQLDAMIRQYPQLSLTPWEKDQVARRFPEEMWYTSLMKLHGSSGGEHLNPQDPKEWVAFQNLMERPWWQRVWVVQELAAGQRRAVVGCGSKWIPWSAFAVANGAIINFRSNPMVQRIRRLASKSDLISELDAICLRLDGRLAGWSGMMIPIFYTLSRKASLPVDRIYALLGFHPHVPMVPDYTKTPEEVYRSFVKLSIHSTNLLAFLAFNWFPKKLKLPSWVPDFSCEFANDEYNVTIPKGAFGADGNLRHNSFVGSPACVLRQSDQDDELTVLGFKHDHPVYVGRPWQGTPEDRELLLRKLSQEYEVAMKNFLEGRISKERLHDALWRTLIWNATSESTYPAPAEYGKEYFSVTKPRDVLMDWNKLSAGIYDPQQHQHIIPVIGLARNYYDSLVKHSLNRRFFITSKGYLGSGPIEMRDNDIVCVLIGFKTPVILRKMSVGGHFQWVGPAYVHGIMNGESLSDKTKIFRMFKLK